MPKATSRTTRGKAAPPKMRKTSKPSPAHSKVHASHASDIDTLRRQLEEAQETLRAITSGEVDALVVAGPAGDQVFTLKDADRPYRHLAEQMFEGVCNLNAQGIVLFANSFLVRLLGVPMEQVIGLPFSRWIRPSNFPKFAQLLEQSLACSAKDEIELMSATGEPLPVQLSLNLLQAEEGARVTAVVLDLRERKRIERALQELNEELEQRVAERTNQLAAANEELEVTNEEYRVANEELASANRMLGREIAERQQVEESLRASEERYRALFDSASDAIIITDPSGPGKVLTVNSAACRLFGYTEAEFQQLDRAAMLEMRDPAVQRALDEREKRGQESAVLTYKRKDGTSFVGEMSSAMLQDPSGRRRALAIIRDITTRQQAEDRITSLNRDLEQRTNELALTVRELESFAYSVSHDLRAPLATIENFARLALEDYGAQLPAHGQHVLQLIQANAEATNRLVQALLQFSRSSREPLNKRAVDMRGIVDQVVSELQTAGGHIDWAIGELPGASADPILIRQVWSNLLSNAIKYSGRRDAPRIEIGTVQQEGGIAYFVKDNGVGFDMGQAQNLFGVFQRLHAEEEYEGTGVGLAIVQRIVTRHGGRVWAEAEVDKGATFYFTLG